MGYHTGADIPNYWKYARDFVLQDHMFQPDLSWSLPSHLYLVSEWSARCANGNPMSCRNAIDHPKDPPNFGKGASPLQRSARLRLDRSDLPAAQAPCPLALLRVQGPGARLRERCRDDLRACASRAPRRPGIWNPLPYFEDVHQDAQLGNIQSLSHFFAAAHTGSLPAVSWIVPNGRVSEHPPALVSRGETYVTNSSTRS